MKAIRPGPKNRRPFAGTTKPPAINDLTTRTPLYTQRHSLTAQQPQAFANTFSLYAAAATALALGTALMAEPAQARQVQPPQPFANNLAFYGPTGAPTVGTALMAQLAPAAPAQQPQRFNNPLGLYVPIPFGSLVFATPRAVEVQQPQRFGNLLGLYPASAVYPSLGSQVFEYVAAPRAVQAPQTFSNPSGQYTTIAYVPPAGQARAQVVIAAQGGQTAIAGAYNAYSANYSPPSAAIAAQLNRVHGQPPSVSSASVTLYAATYTPMATRLDAQVNRQVVVHGFTQGMQLALYQPQIYRPRSVPLLSNPNIAVHSVACQVEVRGAWLGLYATQPVAPINADPRHTLDVAYNGRTLTAKAFDGTLAVRSSGSAMSVEGKGNDLKVPALDRTVH